MNNLQLNPNQARQGQSKWIKPVSGVADSTLTRPFFAVPFLRIARFWQNFPNRLSE
jgi:hypothetical protein